MENMYQFDIFGKTLRLQTTDGNEDDLIRVVKYFMDNVKQVYDANPNRAQTEVLTLAGIKITDELFS
ncbi:MAG: cell division protein ZapA, partial [Spirochaetales bacterium]|nr:cell division protein ZapA [Spirochaetales bacterium]